MRITDIEVIELRVPGWDGSTFDGSYDDCLIRVRGEDGVCGLAEVDSVPSVVRAIVEAPASHRHAMGLKAALLGHDATDIASAWDRMYEATFYYGRRGAVIHAMSGIDIALWDLKGRLEGRPVCDLLGQRRRSKVRAYGTIYPLGETPDEARRAIDRALALGLTAFKICAEPDWHREPDKAEALVRAAREHVGAGTPLMLDAAAAWTRPEDGLSLMPMLAAYGIAWVEAPLPVDDIDGHARFQGFGLPIAGGDLGLTTRFEYRELIDRGRVDIVQPDISMVGGLTEAKRIAAMAAAQGRRLVPHGYKTDILLATNLAFLGQHEAEELLEYSTSQSPLRRGLTRPDLALDGEGCVAVPTEPGLGVSLDDAALERYRVP